jgi:hypothetical protein
VRNIFTRGEDMAKKAPAKKAAEATTKAAAKTPAKKVAAKPAKKPSSTPRKPPPPKKPPAPRSGGEGGSVTFTVRVSPGSLTLEYDGSAPQDFEMLLFVKDEAQARRAQDCIDAMGLRKLVVALGKAYGSP